MEETYWEEEIVMVAEKKGEVKKRKCEAVQGWKGMTSDQDEM